VPKNQEKKTGCVISTKASTVFVKPAEWSKKLHNCLTKEGFTCYLGEHSISTRSHDLGTAILAVHVDDMPVAASSPLAMAGAKAALCKYFDIIDLRPVK